MKLYIETENGLTKNHPAFEDNLMQAFEKIPENWQTFVRVEQPTPTVYQVMVNPEPVYQKVNDVWTDVWSLRDMTAQEIAAKQQEVKDAWAARDQASNWSAWIFEEATCQYIPPIPQPEEEGKNYRWSGADNSWKEAPAYPESGGPYKFDFVQWTWVAV